MYNRLFRTKTNESYKDLFVHVCKHQCNSSILCLSLQPMKASGRAVWLYPHFSPTNRNCPPIPATMNAPLLVSKLSAKSRLGYLYFGLLDAVFSFKIYCQVSKQAPDPCQPVPSPALTEQVGLGSPGWQASPCLLCSVTPASNPC